MLTRLPHRVTVQGEIRTAFEGGAYTTSWTTSGTYWANVQIDRSFETYAQEKKQQYNSYIVTMRDDVSVTNRNRIIYDEKTLVIEDVMNPTGRGRMKKLKCREELQFTLVSAWILNDDASAITGFSYEWDDTETWNDDNVWKD